MASFVPLARLAYSEQKELGFPQPGTMEQPMEMTPQQLREADDTTRAKLGYLLISIPPSYRPPKIPFQAVPGDTLITNHEGEK